MFNAVEEEIALALVLAIVALIDLLRIVTGIPRYAVDNCIFKQQNSIANSPKASIMEFSKCSMD